jgi:hypothetical protein
MATTELEGHNDSVVSLAFNAAGEQRELGRQAAGRGTSAAISTSGSAAAAAFLAGLNMCRLEVGTGWGSM